MAEPVNLNRARKAKARAKAAVQADENALKFGRTKVQKTLEKAVEDKRVAQIDQHKAEP